MTPAELAAEHVGMVYRIARQQRRLRIDDIEEMIGDGMVGLMQAARRYEPSKGVPFEGWAYARVQGAIIDGWRRRHPTGRNHAKRAPFLRFASHEAAREALEAKGKRGEASADRRDRNLLEGVRPSAEDETFDRFALAELLERVAELPESLQSTARVLMNGGMFKTLADAEGVTDGAISHRLTQIRRRLAA